MQNNWPKFGYSNPGLQTVPLLKAGGRRSATSQTRDIGYDDFDRLTTVVSPTTTMFGTALYSYEPIDNLRTATFGAAGFTYGYDGNNRLATVTRSAGGMSTYLTDPAGNILMTSNFPAHGQIRLDFAHSIG